MTEQLNLFSKNNIDSGYPKSMYGKWLNKYPAYAIVDTKEREEELLEMGYIVLEDEEA